MSPTSPLPKSPMHIPEDPYASALTIRVITVPRIVIIRLYRVVPSVIFMSPGTTMITTIHLLVTRVFIHLFMKLDMQSVLSTQEIIILAVVERRGLIYLILKIINDIPRYLTL